MACVASLCCTWGVGWGVWLNGVEVTQVTYFPQGRGPDCQPLSREITYGPQGMALEPRGDQCGFGLAYTDTKFRGDACVRN